MGCNVSREAPGIQNQDFTPPLGHDMTFFTTLRASLGRKSSMRSYGRDKWVTTHIISPTDVLFGYTQCLGSEELYTRFAVCCVWYRLLLTDLRLSDRVHGLLTMTSLNGNIYWPFVRGLHRSPVESPSQRPVTRNLGVFIDVRLNKGLNKQSRCWWFETTRRSLWRHLKFIDTGAKDCNHMIATMPGKLYRFNDLWHQHKAQKRSGVYSIVNNGLYLRHNIDLVRRNTDLTVACIVSLVSSMVSMHLSRFIVKTMQVGKLKTITTIELSGVTLILSHSTQIVVSDFMTTWTRLKRKCNFADLMVTGFTESWKWWCFHFDMYHQSSMERRTELTGKCINVVVFLTHCCLMTPYGVIVLTYCQWDS